MPEVCQFGPRVGRVQEVTNQCFSLTLMFFPVSLFLPPFLFLIINKHVLGRELKKVPRMNVTLCFLSDKTHRHLSPPGSCFSEDTDLMLCARPTPHTRGCQCQCCCCCSAGGALCRLCPQAQAPPAGPWRELRAREPVCLEGVFLGGPGAQPRGVPLCTEHGQAVLTEGRRVCPEENSVASGNGF